ncbi:MAG: PQQ-dependent sugar dehydrogenase [Henriciella sp.]|nr:PQQ-dependent sugar dehydrogenase [Henriciella sp.]
MRQSTYKSSILALALITGCSGGGGGGSTGLSNLAPVFSSTASISIAENSVGVVYTASANDADGDTVTLSITGGPDAGLVTLNASSGELSFTATLDFENPADANGDNVYELSLEARDGRGGVATLNLQITVTDVTETIAVRRVGTGFSQPLGLVALPDGSGRVLVLEKAGRVRVLTPDTGAIASVDFLDVSGSISTVRESGLLGLALSPNFPTDRTLYVNVNNTSGDTEIRRFQTFAGSLDQVDASTSDVILTISQPDSNHNAGWIGFDANGFLVVPTGDGGGSGDPSDFAQNPQSLLGKVLRLDVSGDDFPSDPLRDYVIPAGNTFTDPANGLPEIFAIGLRNPFQSSFDPVSGDLLIGDVGQGAIEEINRLPMTDNSFNFGWAVREGTAFFKGPDQPEFTPPVAEYPRGTGPREGQSVTGGLVYQGPVEAFQDTYIFGDFISNNVWGIPVADLVNGQTVPASQFSILNAEFVPDQGSLTSIAAFGTDEVGNLYIVSLGGDVFRMEAAN